MFSKISPLRIVVDHFGTLKDQGEEKMSGADWFVFFGLPLLLALAALLLCLKASNDFVNLVATSLSIFAALLFNLLLLLFEQVKKTPAIRAVEGADRANLQRELVGQMYKNISFAILVSLGAIVVAILRSLTVTQVGPEALAKTESWRAAGSGINCWLLALDFTLYFLIANFLLTLLMVLKRTYALFSGEFSRTTGDESN